MDLMIQYKCYDKIHSFYLEKVSTGRAKNFGNISQWCREFGKHSQDKNMRQFVLDIIDMQILMKTEESNGNEIFHPDNKGFELCQYKMESIINELGIQNKFDVFRNEKKGTVKLDREL